MLETGEIIKQMEKVYTFGLTGTNMREIGWISSSMDLALTILPMEILTVVSTDMESLGEGEGTCGLQALSMRGSLLRERKMGRGDGKRSRR